jgi:hypothetical protein
LRSDARPETIAVDQVLAPRGLELGLVARVDGLGQRDELEDLCDRAIGLDLAACERRGHVHLAEPEEVGGVGVHAHHDLGLHFRLPEVDVGRPVLLEPEGDLRFRLAIVVLEDRVRLPELGPELRVVGEVHEQLAEHLVDLLGVLEVRQLSPPVGTANPM